MNQSKFNKLIKKYQHGKLGAKGERVMNSWFNALSTKEDVWSPSEMDELRMRIEEQIVHDQAALKTTILGKKWRAIAAAAAILVAASIGIYFYSDFGSSQPAAEIMANNPAPGGNKASLKLADGREFSLRNDQEEIIIQDHSFVYKDGSDLGNMAPDQQQSATLSTPRSGQYRITLSDGSKVWLNADSKLTYPIRFDQEKRIVKLEGEAYFEIKDQFHKNSQNAHSKTKVPFLVLMNGQQVEVLGTQFNISGYSDEDHLITTLIKGSVKVSLIDQDHLPLKQPAIILSPGQQTILQNGQLSVHPIDVNEAIAWKNGNFMFNDEEIESVMRKLARWYDVEVIYQGEMKDIKIWGSVSRSKHIGEVLKVIALTKLVKFEVKGRRVHVVRI